jgi:hypothetical protein
MTFAEAGNFATPNLTLNDANDARKQIAERITFPDITGRDAPGKTGSAAKPALVSNIGLLVSGVGTGTLPDGSPFNFTTNARLSMWSSTGTNRVSSATFTLPLSTSPTLQTRTISDRAVFAGTQYWVGFTKETFGATSRYYFSGTSVPFTGVFGPDPTSFSTVEPNFVANISGYSINLGWRLGYDVLPTAPISPSGSVSGVDIALSWSAPSSNGGRAVSGYRIQRSTDGVTFTTIVDNTNSTGTTYTDTNLTPGRTYTYRVAAINAVAIAAGSDYSGPYATTAGFFVAGVAGNLTSLLTATVSNPEPVPVLFSDFGLGIRFTAINVQYGSEFLYNEIEATTQDSFADTQIVEAPQSKQLYGVRSYSINNLLNSTDQGAFEVAKDYLTYYFQPELRVQSITVDLANLTLEEKLQILNLEIDSYISISFTPNGVGDPKIAAGLVTGISHRISITSHEVELRLRNERNLFTLNSDSKGILNVNILGP